MDHFKTEGIVNIDSFTLKFRVYQIVYQARLYAYAWGAFAPSFFFFFKF